MNLCLFTYCSNLIPQNQVSDRSYNLRKPWSTYNFVTGFALGYTVQSQTKGIWIWAVPHPANAGDKYLLLMDTEGLGDVHKVNTG